MGLYRLCRVAKLFLFFALAELLCACTPRPTAMPKDLSAYELAALLEGQVSTGGADGEEEVLLSGDRSREALAVIKLVPLESSMAAAILRTRQAVEPHDSSGNEPAEDATVRLLYLKWTGHAWALHKAPSGSIPLAGADFEVKDVVELRPGYRAFMIQHGSASQGYMVSGLALIALDRGEPKVLADIVTESSNAGACTLETDCWDGRATLSFTRAGRSDAMPDIHVRQTLVTAHSPIDEPAFQELHPSAQRAIRDRYSRDDRRRRTTVTHGEIVYGWSGTSFQVRSGASIIPEP